MTENKCPSCGSAIAEDSRYCPKCGIDLRANITPEKEKEVEPEQEQVQINEAEVAAPQAEAAVTVSDVTEVEAPQAEAAVMVTPVTEAEAPQAEAAVTVSPVTEAEAPLVEVAVTVTPVTEVAAPQAQPEGSSPVLTMFPGMAAAVPAEGGYVPPVQPSVAPPILTEEEDGDDEELSPEQEEKQRKAMLPMSSWGTALSIIVMSIPILGYIIMIIWACGGCRKIGRRNLARAFIILFILLLVLLVVSAILARFVYADEITRIFEQMMPGYTIQWG